MFFVDTERPLACTFDSVRRHLLQEENDARKAGTTYLHEETPASFVRQALDIEERQYVLNCQSLLMRYILTVTQAGDAFALQGLRRQHCD